MGVSLFSVIIPTFNRRHTIGQSIDSVLKQVNAEIEIIIIDDGSTDDTVAWVTKKYPSNSVRVLHNHGAKGPAGARNTGILAAQGEFVAFLDSDDLFLPEHLLECQRIFSMFPAVDIIFGRAIYINNDTVVDYMGPNFDKKLRYAPVVYQDDAVTVFSEDYFAHLLEYGCYFNLSSVVMRSCAAQELMNERLRIAEDYEFWVRLSRKHRFACLHSPQIHYLLHNDNISFEESASVAGNAPNLLTAYNIMLAYPSLTEKQIKLIKANIAEVLFDWGYSCRKNKQILESMKLHWQSLFFGKRIANAAALLKLALISFWERLFSPST